MISMGFNAKNGRVQISPFGVYGLHFFISPKLLSVMSLENREKLQKFELVAEEISRVMISFLTFFTYVEKSRD